MLKKISLVYFTQLPKFKNCQNIFFQKIQIQNYSYELLKLNQAIILSQPEKD